MSLLSPQLQAFIAVAQHKTVHGAADAIHMTQTAVTQRIRVLEGKLGASLFTRSRRGMLLTPEGEALLRYCYAVNEIEGEALAKIKGAGVLSQIRICITGPSSIMGARIIPQCLKVMKKFPNLLMHFDINDLESRVQTLRSGVSQFAIVRAEDVAPEMAHKMLEPERYVLVCTPEWKKRKLHEIISQEHIIDYDPTDPTTFNYLKTYSLLDWVEQERHFANRTDILALMLTEGYGYGVLTEEFSKPYIKQNQLMVLNAGKLYEVPMALAWYNRPNPAKYFSALVKAME